MDLYAENILDHFRSPHHYGRLEMANLTGKDSNPLCGDSLVMDFVVDAENRINDIGFTGRGCAISQASASMLTDELLGKTLEDALELTNEDIYKMLQVPLTPARVKCALLSLYTVKKAVTLDRFQ